MRTSIFLALSHNYFNFSWMGFILIIGRNLVVKIFRNGQVIKTVVYKKNNGGICQVFK